METEMNKKPVATVTGLFRAKSGGFERLTVDKPLTREEVLSNPIFYELDLNPEESNKNLIIDLIYDHLLPLRLPDLRRGTDIPQGVWFWTDWFEIPPYEEMYDFDGRKVYPRAPGIHTIQIRIGCRRFDQMGRFRDFSPQNGGYESPVFEIRIAEDNDV